MRFVSASLLSLFLFCAPAHAWPTFSSDSFLGLSDTPDSYFGYSGKCLAVNSLETGIEFAVCGGGGGTPGGSDTQVQFNDSGSFAGDSGLVFNKTTNVLTVGEVIISGLTASRAVYSNGSKQLTSSTVTDTELGYLSGVSSAIQTQINGKQATLTTGNLTATSPLSLNNTRQLIGGAADVSIANADADGTTKGAAAFNATYFDASLGVITADLTNGLASGSQGGWLSSANFTTFNNKVSQTGAELYAADSVGSDAYAITLSPALGAYAAGNCFTFKAGTANTGAATLNVNGLGAKSILKQHDVALDDNDIESAQTVTVCYDGTNFQMQSQIANAGGGSGDITSVWSTASGAVTTPTIGSGERLDGGTATTDSNNEGIILPNGTAPAGTTEAQTGWDTDDSLISIGDGAVALHITGLYVLPASNSSRSATFYISCMGESTTLTNVDDCRVGVSTFSHMTIALQTAPGVGQSWVATLVVNGSSTAITCTIADAATTCTDNTHIVHPTVGQKWYIQVVETSASAGTGDQGGSIGVMYYN